MSKFRNTRQVRTGADPSVLDKLADPKVLAVVWTGVWSRASLAFADRVIERPEHNVPGSAQVLLTELPENSGFRTNRAFNNDLDRFTRIFEKLGVGLLGRSRSLDLSRTVPA